jgi:hypothetical protein
VEFVGGTVGSQVPQYRQAVDRLTDLRAHELAAHGLIRELSGSRPEVHAGGAEKDRGEQDGKPRVREALALVGGTSQRVGSWSVPEGGKGHAGTIGNQPSSAHRPGLRPSASTYTEAGAPDLSGTRMRW